MTATSSSERPDEDPGSISSAAVAFVWLFHALSIGIILLIPYL